MTSPPNRLLQERRLGAGALSLILLGQCIAAVLPLVFFRCTMVRSKWSSSIFHESVGDGRQRDIFPIPSLDAGGLKRQHVATHVFFTSQAFKRASCKRLRLARGSVAKEQGSAMQRFKSVRTFCKLWQRLELQTIAKCSRTSGHLIPKRQNKTNNNFQSLGEDNKSLSPPRSPWPPVKSRLKMTEAFCRDVNLFKGGVDAAQFPRAPWQRPGVV